MTTPATQNASPNAPGGGQAGASQLVTEQGTTTIADTVVQKIAGLAASEIAGVYALGGGAARAFGALRERIPGASASAAQGVSVEVGERQTAVDLELVVEYGVSIVDLARAARRNVILAIERMTGLEVVEVNIAVNDVHLPDEEADTEGGQTTRLQ
ncbi:Asp23/Gls24 family envelope stress response protein [Amycolatopsis endophytica]|uniref:Putative alkaline shock family protein YloU n=1 Tax=Amycolatopsis endophytica TaxID=860233 RepID=A0A853BDZ6_9PSEU|nr:Asp23/Gls24 family envelope stress response protein [Amycolatopsis endophytica]NYI93668.1 putative alkaline shock family protein YloU [Amycolatopsis endophytica]